MTRVGARAAAATAVLVLGLAACGSSETPTAASAGATSTSAQGTAGTTPSANNRGGSTGTTGTRTSKPTTPPGTRTASPTVSSTGRNPCRGTSGTGASGKRRQTIHFPQLGERRFPEVAVALRACATSGLPVSYELAGQNTGCQLQQRNGVWHVFVSNAGQSCTVRALQGGDDEYEQAEPVDRPFRVAFQIVALRWGRHATSAPPNSSVRIPVRVTSRDPLAATIMIEVDRGPCSRPETQFVKESTAYDLVFVVGTGATAGECTLSVSAQSSNISGGGAGPAYIRVGDPGPPPSPPSPSP